MPPKRIPKARSYPRCRNEENNEDDEELNELFRQAKDFSEENNSSSFNNKLNDKFDFDEECKHLDTIRDNSFILCNQCGLQLSGTDEENQHKMDSIQFKKCPDKGIAKDLEIYNLHPDVIRLADKYYASVTNGIIKRSNLRKGIMFACVFHAYKELGKPQTPDHLQKIFNIDRKNISKGLTFFCLGVPNRNTEQYITAEHFIPKQFEKLNLRDDLIPPCVELFKQIENKSSLLNRSNPQSVSKGVVFYYLRKLDSNIDLQSYSERVELSPTTIQRICNIIDSLLTPT